MLDRKFAYQPLTSSMHYRKEENSGVIVGLAYFEQDKLVDKPSTDMNVYFFVIVYHNLPPHVKNIIPDE